MTRASSYWMSAFVLIASAIVATAWLYPQLPDRLPTHWNIQGKADAWGPKSSAWIIPGVMVGLLGLFRIVPRLGPRSKAIDPHGSAYLTVMLTGVALMGAIHALMLRAAFVPWFDIVRAMVACLMPGLALIGTVMGRIKPNLYMGIRTTWTLANDRVWAETHRIGGRWLVGAGIFGCLAALSPLPIWVAPLPLVLAIVRPILFSFRLYKQMERAGTLNEATA